MILDTSDKTASLTLTYCAAWSLGQCPVDMGGKQKMRMEHIDTYERIKLNGKLIILGNVAQ